MKGPTKRSWAPALLMASALLVAPAVASAGHAAKVSLLQGQAQVLRAADKHSGKTGPKDDAPWKTMKVGTQLQEGDAIRTQAKTRLELLVPDGSRVRLGSKSSMVLSQGHFKRSGERKVTFTLWLGKVWAKVAKRVGGKSSFEVKTQNAVAGVRGTSFAVLAQVDASSVVKVYTGSVGVKKNAAGTSAPTKRRQVAGPQRIDKKQWEEVIATAMTQVKITSVGQIQPAEDFIDEGEDLQWAMWNQERDQAVR